MIERGEVWWADLEAPRGSEPGFRRPVVIVQADAFNRSRIRTALVVILTSNLRLLAAPGNVLAPASSSGLPADSCINVSQVVTLDRAYLLTTTGRLNIATMVQVDAGLKLVLDLP